MIENLVQAEDKYEAAVAVQPMAANTYEAAELRRVANTPEMDKLRRAYPIEKDSTAYNLPEELGMV
jgi:hypothetical protein